MSVILKDPKTGQFLPGTSNGGKKKGARNRLHGDFVIALQEHFSERGQTAIEIVFRESPKEYLKIIASVLPKEFILEDGRLESMGDDELEQRLADIKRIRATADRGLVIEGTRATPEREQAPVLYAIPKAEELP